jgi:YD repeat-containing protein
MPKYILILILALLAELGFVSSVFGQSSNEADICEDVGRLMNPANSAFSVTSSLPNNGILSAGQLVEATLEPDVFSHTWMFSVAEPDNSAEIIVELSGMNDMLDYAVYSGVTALTESTTAEDFVHMDSEGIPINDGGLYTIAIRRNSDIRLDTHVSYQLRVQFAETLFPDFPQSGLVSEREIFPFAAVNGSTENRFTDSGNVNSPSVMVRTYPDTLQDIYQNNAGEDVLWQLYFKNNSQPFIVADWISELSITGGSLFVTGNVDNQRRTLFISDFSLEEGFDASKPLLDLIEDSRGTRVVTDWGDVTDIWLVHRCVGFRLVDGRFFTAEVDSIVGTNVNLAHQQDTPALYDISLLWFGADDIEKQYDLTLAWQLIAAMPDNAPSIQLKNGNFALNLVGNRQLSIETAQLTIQENTTVPAVGDGSKPVTVQALRDSQPIELNIDWTNLFALRLFQDAEDEEPQLEMTFHDTQDVRDGEITSRSASNLRQVQAIADVVHLVYSAAENSDYAIERVLLPASESYIELVMKNGTPQYDVQAYPNQADYSPRSLNNTGSECLPLNTFLPEFNCSGNGDINPANGNLWYAITDHQATGLLLDLTLTRSYNSRLAHRDGAFGYGWTAGIQLDYTVAYDATTLSRPVNFADGNITYGVALDLTWSPGGFVTFMTPSGSQHLFVIQDSAAFPQIYRAVTMPGWSLRRDDAGWLLQQESGLHYQFDRAGRLLGYGYPNSQRWISIDYVNAAALHLNGLGSEGSDVVILSDAPDVRRLELYYDRNGRIVNSMLRDMSVVGDVEDSSLLEECEFDQNCTEITYEYSNGYLERVNYPNGQVAEYRYQSREGQSGLMTRYRDIRAQMIPAAELRYEENYITHIFPIAYETPIDAPVPASAAWRILTPQREGDRLSVDVQDEFGATMTYTYRLSTDLAPDIAVADTAFNLIGLVDPAISSTNENIVWEDGYLTRIEPFYRNSILVRNSTHFEIDPITGRVASVTGHNGHVGGGSYPGYEITANEELLQQLGIYRPITVDLSDNTTLQFQYDGHGQPISFSTVEGQPFSYEWNADSLPIGYISPDGQRTQYEYMEPFSQIGMATSVIRYPAPADISVGYRLEYRYDGFGRITHIYDPTLGGIEDASGNWTYRIFYGRRPTACTEGACFLPLISVRDAVNSITTYNLNQFNQLELVQTVAGNDLLRQTSYQYADYLTVTENTVAVNPFYRRTTEIRQHNENADRVLAYAYKMLEGGGYEITVTEANGSETVYDFDSYHQLIKVVTPLQEEIQYSYETRSGKDDLVNVNMVVIETNTFQKYQIEYWYDFGRRLRQVVYFNTGSGTPAKDYIWRIDYLFPEADDSIPERLLYQVKQLELDIFHPGGQSTIYSQQWTNQADANAIRVGYRHWESEAAAMQLADDNPALNMLQTSLIREYDALGRITSQQISTAQYQKTLYCVLSQGRLQVVEYMTNTAAGITCSDMQGGNTPADYSTIAIFDAHHRLLCMDERGTGVRRYTYEAMPTSYQWRVRVQSDGAVLNSSCNAEAAPSSLTETFVYNAVGDLPEWTDVNGISHSFQYDKLGQIVEAVIGGIPESPFYYQYYPDGRLWTEQDSAGYFVEYQYEQGLLVLKKNRNADETTTYLYDENGRLTSQFQSSGSVLRYQYNDSLAPMRVTDIIDEMGNTHNYQWNDKGGEITYTDPLRRETIYGFDTNGLLWRIQDSLSNHYLINYDQMGRMTAWLQGYEYEFEPRRALSMTYPDNNQIRVQYAGLPPITTLTMQPSGQIAAINVNDAVMTLTYDPWQRQQSITAANAEFAFSYVAGQPTIEISNFGTLTFDHLYRLVDFQQVNGEQLQYQYHDEGFEILRNGVSEQHVDIRAGTSLNPPQIRLWQTDNLLQVFTYSLNRRYLIESILHEVRICEDNTVLSQACSTEGNELDTWASNTRFVYDSRGLPTSIIDARQNVESFSYDDVGNLISYQTVTRDNFNYAYDKLNRLHHITGLGGITLWLQYTPIGNQVVGICRSQASNTQITDYQTCEMNGVVLETYQYNVAGKLVAQQFTTVRDNTLAPVGHYINYASAPGTSARDVESVTDMADRLLIEMLYASQYRSSLAAITVHSDQQEINYGFAYDLFGRVTAESGNDEITYAYDTSGKLAALSIDGRTYQFQYDATGYSLTDTSNGFQLRYALDSNHLLQSIHYSTPTDTGSTEITYALLRGNKVAVTTNSAQLTGSNIEFDSLGTAQSILFPGQISFDYIRDASDTVVQQTIIAFENDSFVTNEGSYFAVTTYDKNRQPTAMQLSHEGQILYTVIYTYDQWGQLIEELKQVPGFIQEGTIYRYGMPGNPTGSSNLLTSQEITVTENQREQSINSGILATLPIGGIVLLLGRRRRRRFLLLCIFAALGLGYVTQAQERAVFTLSYNDSGNISRIASETCATNIQFEYDGAGRLIQQDGSHIYNYDSLNRVVQIDDLHLSYVGQSRTPFAVSDGTGTTLFAQTRDGIQLFSMTSSGVVPAIYNGNGEALPQAHDGETPQTLWVFDPHFHPIFLRQSTSPTVTSCIWNSTRSEQFVTTPIVVVMDDFIWHPASNLFFHNGRAYSPQLGQFLQRDPLGPDVTGRLYYYPSRNITPPIRYWQAPYLHGLDMLVGTLDTIAENQLLTSAAIRQHYLSGYTGSVNDSLLEGLGQSQLMVQNALNRQIDVIKWLHQSYNYDVVRIDPRTGAVRLPTITTPGQGGWTDVYQTNQPDLLSSGMYPYQRGQIMPSLQTLITWANAPLPNFTTYVPAGWRPTQLLDVSNISYPAPLVIEQPGDVRGWLPQPLNTDFVQTAVNTVGLIETLEQVPNMSSDDWFMRQMSLALPTLPARIPVNLDEVKANWFTTDTLNTIQYLQALWNPPLPPVTPGFSLGIVADEVSIIPYPSGYAIDASISPIGD